MLYAQVEARNGKVYTLTHLAAAPWPNGSFRKLGKTLDRSVGSFAITPDGSKVYFTAEDAGLERLYVLDPSKDRVSAPLP